MIYIPITACSNSQASSILAPISHTPAEKRINICDGSNQESIEHNSWYCGQVTGYQCRQPQDVPCFHPTTRLDTMENGQVHRKIKVASYALGVLHNSALLPYEQWLDLHGPAWPVPATPYLDETVSCHTMSNSRVHRKSPIDEQPKFSTSRVHTYAPAVLQNVQIQNSAPSVDMSQGDSFQIRGGYGSGTLKRFQRAWPDIHPFDLDTCERSATPIQEIEYGYLAPISHTPERKDEQGVMPGFENREAANTTLYTTTDGVKNRSNFPLEYEKWCVGDMSPTDADINFMVDGSITSAPTLDELCATITSDGELRPSKITQGTAPELEVNHDLSVTTQVNRDPHVLIANAIECNAPVMDQLARTRICDTWDIYIPCDSGIGKNEKAYRDNFQHLINQYKCIQWTSTLSDFFAHFEGLQRTIPNLPSVSKQVYTKAAVNLFSRYCLERFGQSVSNPVAQPPLSLERCFNKRSLLVFSTLLIAIRINPKIMKALANITLGDALENPVHTSRTLARLNKIVDLSNYLEQTSSLNEFVSYFENLCELIQNYKEEQSMDALFEALLKFSYCELGRVIPYPTRATQSTAFPRECEKWELNLYRLTASAILLHDHKMGQVGTIPISQALTAWIACSRIHKTTAYKRLEAFQALIGQYKSIDVEAPLSSFFAHFESLEQVIPTLRHPDDARSALNSFSKYYLQQAGQQISNSLGQRSTFFTVLSTDRKFSLFPTLLIAIRANTDIMNALADVNLENESNVFRYGREILPALRFICQHSGNGTQTSSLKEFVCDLEDSYTVIANSTLLKPNRKTRYIHSVLNFICYFIDQKISRLVEKR